jgi:hypothetical protein
VINEVNLAANLIESPRVCRILFDSWRLLKDIYQEQNFTPEKFDGVYRRAH